MQSEQNKLDSLIEKVKSEELCISSEEVLANIASRKDNKPSALRHLLKLKALLTYAAAAAILTPIAYLLTNDEPAPKNIAPIVSQPAAVLDSVVPNPVYSSTSKIVKAEEPEKPVDLTENLKLLEHISIENEKGHYTFYFKNDSLVLTELNGVKLSKKQYTAHKAEIDYANQLRKSYKEFEASVDYNSADFKKYMLDELLSRGIINDSVYDVKFSKNEVSIDSLKIDNAIINEIIAKYKSGILK